MNAATLQSLLRRTAVAIAATAASLIAVPASALTMSLPNSVTCTNPSISTQPDGSLMLTCASTSGGTTTPPPPPPPTTGPDTFTVGVPTSLALSTAGSATITRSGTPSPGNVGINYAVSGSCVGNPGSGQIVFTPTTAGPVNIPITGAATAGTCTVNLNVGYGTGILMPGGTGIASVSFPVSGTSTVTPPPPPPPSGTPTGTGGSGALPYNVATIFTKDSLGNYNYTPGLNGAAVPVVAGCAAPDPSTRMGNLPLPNGTYINPLMAGSTVVTSFPLYGLAQFGRGSAGVNFGETPFSYSPAPYTADISISPCPGVIPATYDVRANCDRRGEAANNGFSLGWVNSASSPIAYFNCVAPETTQYYYNVRWHYDPGTCAQGQTTCGFSVNTN
jgi:hypothetical protein